MVLDPSSTIADIVCNPTGSWYYTTAVNVHVKDVSARLSLFALAYGASDA
jgi:hypothetical protein